LRGSVHPVITAIGDPGWLVTGHTEVLAWLDDDRLGRSHPDPARAARTGDSMLFGGPAGAFDTEKADHTRMRALLQPHVTPARMRALRPRVELLTAELLDSMAAGDRPSDLVQAVAVPLPVLVICELLGVPSSDRDQFRAWTRDAANVADRRRSMAGLGALFSYGQQLVAAKRDQPADDVISRLAATPGVGAVQAAQLSMSLLFAGHETTVDQIGKGALQLLAAPGQWAALARDPSRVPAAVEEILRTTGKGGGGIPRYAREHVQIGGVDIAAGDLVIFDLGAANHDPAAITDPGLRHGPCCRFAPPLTSCRDGSVANPTTLATKIRSTGSLVMNLIYSRRVAQEVGPPPVSWAIGGHRLLEGIPIVSSDLLPAARRGDVVIKPAIDRLLQDRVHFVDGSEEVLDRIIYCTGYRISLPFLSPALVSANGRDFPLYRRIVPPNLSGLFLAGFVDAPTGLLPAVEAQGQWIAAVLAGRLPLPRRERMWLAMGRPERRTRQRFPGEGPYSIRCDPHGDRRLLRADLRRARQRVVPSIGSLRTTAKGPTDLSLDHGSVR
jgi:hypothetical protein